jgi:hypothetical protein
MGTSDGGCEDVLEVHVEKGASETVSPRHKNLQDAQFHQAWGKQGGAECCGLTSPSLFRPRRQQASYEQEGAWRDSCRATSGVPCEEDTYPMHIISEIFR